MLNLLTSHLTSFALVSDPVQPLDSFDAKPGFYINYVAMNYWQDSFGFYAVISVSGMYLISLTIAIICDIRPRKRLRAKIEEELA